MIKSGYNKTIGTIIDYNKLYRFLLNDSLFFNNCDIIIDAPCGTGLLFNAMINSQKRFVGIDISESQLSQIKHNIQLIKHDIFKLKDLALPTWCTNAYLHCGFSFFNIFNSEERQKLLEVIFNLKKVASFGFEIQNKEFQDINFQYGKWFESLLPNNKILKTKSSKFSTNSYKLEMIFDGNEKHEEILHYWTINDCINDCLNTGWKNITIKYASYRKPINSHYFIELNR